ncbi:MAG: C40 family peptidase, partial [Clostridia bacterium]|nr:C40 family peptidase [Clostridia bacterium]
ILLAVALGVAAAAVLCIMLFSGPGRYEPLTQEEINVVLARNENLTENQQAVLEAGLSLLVRVHYFWGGKSNAVGDDPLWGEMMEVTSPGSETSGTLRPFGLDCSGYVSWIYRQLGYTPQEVDALIGSGTWNQWEKSEKIRWRDLQVGDFVFQNKYPGAKGNHIGICIGRDEAGDPVFMHCASGFDNVVVTHAGDVFKHARRPVIR